MGDVKLVEFLTKDGQGKVYVQASSIEVPSEVGVIKAKEIAKAAIEQRPLEKFEEVGQFIADRADELLEKIKAAGAKAKPDKITLHFGICISGEGKILFIAKGSAEANIWVELEWNTKGV